MADAIRPDLMHCPKCGAEMPLHHYPESDAYRCSGCLGLWLPMMSHERLEEYADELDPSPYQHSPGPEPRTLACPQCKPAQLIRMVDASQPEIHFESCQQCFGRYYDAGEFREVSEDPGFLQRLFGSA